MKPYKSQHRFYNLLTDLHFIQMRNTVVTVKTVPLHATEALGGRGGIAPTHFQPWSRWGWVVSVTPRPRFSSGERTTSTHCTGGWVGPRAGLDTEVRGKILSPLPEIACKKYNAASKFPFRSLTTCILMTVFMEILLRDFGSYVFCLYVGWVMIISR
jgi:hypothetical protein